MGGGTYSSPDFFLQNCSIEQSMCGSIVAGNGSESGITDWKYVESTDVSF